MLSTKCEYFFCDTDEWRGVDNAPSAIELFRVLCGCEVSHVSQHRLRNDFPSICLTLLRGCSGVWLEKCGNWNLFTRLIDLTLKEARKSSKTAAARHFLLSIELSYSNESNIHSESPFDTRKSLHLAEALVLHTSTRPSLLFSQRNVLKASSCLFSVSQLLPILSFHTNERESRQRGKSCTSKREPQHKSQTSSRHFLAFKFKPQKNR